MVPYKQLGRDAGGSEMFDFAIPFVALEEDLSENNVVSSLITLTDNTTEIEVAAVGAAAAIKWIATGDTIGSVITAAGTTADFDFVIPPNMMRRFPVPIEKFVAQTSVVGLNKQYGLYNRVAVKSVAIGSILTTQY